MTAFRQPYSPREDRLPVRDEDPLPGLGLFGQRRDDLSQGQQGLVDAGALLHRDHNAA